MIIEQAPETIQEDSNQATNKFSPRSECKTQETEKDTKNSPFCFKNEISKILKNETPYFEKSIEFKENNHQSEFLETQIHFENEFKDLSNTSHSHENDTLSEIVPERKTSDVKKNQLKKKKKSANCLFETKVNSSQDSGEKSDKKKKSHQSTPQDMVSEPLFLGKKQKFENGLELLIEAADRFFEEGVFLPELLSDKHSKAKYNCCNPSCNNLLISGEGQLIKEISVKTAFCNDCIRAYKKKNHCVYCVSIYHDSTNDQKSWIECESCKTWNHFSCEESQGFYKNISKQIQMKKQFRYVCGNCRGQKNSKKSKNSYEVVQNTNFISNLPAAKDNSCDL